MESLRSTRVCFRQCVSGNAPLTPTLSPHQWGEREYLVEERATLHRGYHGGIWASTLTQIDLASV